MSATEAVRVVTTVRAVIGVPLLFLWFRMIRIAWADLARLPLLGINGMYEVILRGQVKFGVIRLVASFLMTLSSWALLPVVFRISFSGRQSFAAVAVLIYFVVGEAIYCLEKQREQRVLMSLSRADRQKNGAARVTEDGISL